MYWDKSGEVHNIGVGVEHNTQDVSTLQTDLNSKLIASLAFNFIIRIPTQASSCSLCQQSQCTQ